MQINRNELLNDLVLLRDKLIEKEKKDHHQDTEICTDNALKEIAEKKPLSKSDFYAIQGIKKSIVDRYSQQFLDILNTYKKMTINERRVSKNAYQILDHYKDRLTNLNRRNKNLYMGRLTKKHALDLTDFPIYEELIDFLTNQRKKVINLPINDELYNKVKTIYRETNKAEKEYGSYELYVAYPYIEGVFKEDSFTIRAPLCYIPVKLSRNKKHFKLKKNTDKDIVFNRDLLLVVEKYLLNKTVKETPFIKTLNKQTIKTVVIPFFEDVGLTIRKSNITQTFSPFESIRKDQFRKRKKNVFNIIEYVTLGRYKRHSSMIQKDMNEILDKKSYNDLLEGLIEEEHLYDKEPPINFSSETAQIKESELQYQTDINYSQEQVLQGLNHSNKLVIWGPPGTGKSQTITNLITSRILKNENVLVVSEKKVALDVIYSRLKENSNYTMFLDDAEDKQSFFKQLSTFIDPTPPIRTLNNDIYSLEQEIDEIITSLNRALTLLKETKINEKTMEELYHRYIKNSQVDTTLTPKAVHQMFLDYFKKPTINQVEAIEKTFSRTKKLREALEFQHIIQQFPQLKKYNLKLTRSDRVEYENFGHRFEKVFAKYKNSWFFNKRNIKKEFIKTHKKTLLFFIKKKRHAKKFLKLIFKKPELYQYIADNLSRLHLIKKHYDALTKDELTFIKMLRTHETVSHIDDIAKKRNYLFNAFFTGYLESFETKNQLIMQYIYTYQEKFQELNKLREQKKQILTESAEMNLYEEALHLSHCKRIMDIKRVLESKRKMSVPAFINYFQLELLNHIKIWLLTPEVVSSILPLVHGMFDTVIFDEASQLYVEKGIPAIYRAKKVVIAGDTKQLRPSSLGMGRVDITDEFYEESPLTDISLDAKSLLDLARYKYNEIILNYHYRSRYEELIAFSNHAFYNANLFVSPNQTSTTKPPIEYVYVKDAVFADRSNDKEAKKVIYLIRKIFRERQNNESIGVITFNSTQRDLIEDLIDEQLFKRGKYQKLFQQELFREDDNEDQSLFIKNIENVQGDERDIIIFSMGYGKDENGRIRRHFGWLNQSGGENRLNVAITRAKQKIFFLSSLKPGELKVNDLKNRGPKLLKEYMNYCYMISNNNKQAASQLLQGLYQKESDKTVKNNHLVSNLYSKLKRTLTVHKNIGIGNYKIDLAIFNEETNTYSLAILCDTTYNNSRKKLYHQEKYLQARGWNTLRVFSSIYYKDPNKVARQIRKIARN
ncbi:MAG: DUF4011 domain-containing protein [Candidatus Izimaplasma sp.]|nr:DUF4011 domain-containing protein [Candidatus Izimaplasma bacterium]